jgi:adenosylcobinamide-phosphate synthase
MDHIFAMDHWLILAIALIIDRLVGDPALLWQRVPHPVVIFGKAISVFDRALNRDSAPSWLRRVTGVICIASLTIAAFLIGAAFEEILYPLALFGLAVKILIVSVLLAQKSLSDHVRAVMVGLEKGLDQGRSSVSLIVGRDPATLDEAGVSRAAIESLAENFSDAVVAPAICYALLGLPGLFAYKLINTADSMIGHRTPRHESFGWAAAKLDDLVNWPAARLSWLLIAVAARLLHGKAVAQRAFKIGWRDARLHRSPNSGWPEAAMAGALDVQLAGPRIYAGEIVKELMMNAQGRAPAGREDIDQGLRLYESACDVLLMLAVVGAVMGAIF